MNRTRFVSMLLACVLGSCSDDPSQTTLDLPAAPDSRASSGKEASAPVEAGTSAPDVGAPTSAKLGAVCVATTSCEKGGSGIAKCRLSWPSGYCLVEGCSSSAMDCPRDPGMGAVAVGAGKCVLAPTPTCLLMCGAESDCRSGYQCTARADAMGHGEVKVCVPK